MAGAAVRVILDGAGGLGDAVEAGLLGQEPADLEVGVDAGLDPAEDLHQQAMLEQHHGVALLGGPGNDLQGSANGPPGAVKGGRPQGPELTPAGGCRAVRFDRGEQGPAGAVIEQAVMESGRSVARFQGGDDPLWRLALDVAGVRPVSDGQGQEVQLRAPVVELGVHQRQEARFRKALGPRRVGQAHGVQLPRLAGEPALPPEEVWQGVAFHALPVRPFDDGFPDGTAFAHCHG